MTRKKTGTNLIFLAPAFSEIISAKSDEIRPFFEVFIHDPENLTQQNLGTLFGVLEITDRSEDSSYIVNYIISEVKKEFYKNPKRGCIESFESALHKANLCLSKLAQHENIAWIGKFNAFLGVIEKNNLHFSLTGKVLSLLIRNKALSEIGEDMTEEATANPLKTFTDIASGKLEEDDRIIISTPEISDIFSSQEIKKASLRFSEESFIQFLRTALSNELDQIGALVVSIGKKKKSLPTPTRKAHSSTPNVWSQKAFSQVKNKQLLANAQEEISEKEKETQTTGHIYIKEAESFEEKPASNSLDNLKAAFSETRNRLHSLKKNPLKEKPGQGIQKKTNVKKWSEYISNTIGKFARPSFSSNQKPKQVFSKVKHTIRKISGRFSFSIPLRPSSLTAKRILSRTTSPIKNLVRIFKSLSVQEKILALVVVFLIFVVPLFFAFWKSSPTPQKSEEEVAESQTNQELPSSQETFTSQGSFETLDSEISLESLLLSGNDLFGIKESALYLISEKKEFALEPAWGKIVDSAFMPDLNLILLLTNNKKLLSFSPSSQKFQENNLALPEGSNFKMLGTYLTYLYILDESQNQIYRYPRAEGGFGERSDWLKETADLKDITDSAINENIFLLKDGNVLKYWRGKKQVFPLENNFQGDAIDSFEDSLSLFVLTRQDNSIAVFDNNGQQQEKFLNQNLSSAKEILVSPNNNREFFILLENGTPGKISF